MKMTSEKSRHLSHESVTILAMATGRADTGRQKTRPLGVAVPRVIITLLLLPISVFAANQLGAMEKFYPGRTTFVESQSHATPFAAVFEDGGTTGYFYGQDSSAEGNPILDALHIYNVQNVSDGDIESELRIVWSADGAKVALLINGYPHAVFDFIAERAYCRTGLPPPSERWSAQGHGWDDQALQFFIE